MGKINPMLAELDAAVRHQVLYARAASLFGLGHSSVTASSAA
jgi:hypothetical protein